MKRFIANGWFVAMLGLVLLSTCCASYYKVTDPHTGKEYYTEDVSTVQGGAVKLKDTRTGSTVTIQNSEVKEISEKEYKAGLAAPAVPASKSTPTSAPTPTVAPALAPAAAPAPAPAEAPAKAPAAEPSSAPSGT